MQFFRPLLVLASLVLFFSCRKDAEPVKIRETHEQQKGTLPQDTSGAQDTIPQGTSEVSFRWLATAGNATISNSTNHYSNGLGDLFTVSRFNYYISNVKLRRTDGFIYAEPESYHLIRHLEKADTFTLTGVPAGYYTQMEFIIGVDSIRNVSGAQSGALDPAWDMFWDWNSGYIFYKLEGTYKAMSSAEGDYSFHIGGFSGPDKCLQTVTIDLGSVRVDKKSVAMVELAADAAAIFNTPHQISFDDYFLDPPTPRTFRHQSENYADMFSLKTVAVVEK